MTILITGAAGQLGQALQRAFNEKNIAYHALDRQQADITDIAQLLPVCLSLQPTLIINAAAYTAVDKAEQDYAAAFAVNVDGVKHLAMVCQMLDIPLIHFSTDYVFDGQKLGAYLENDPANPVNVYGETKWLGEEMLRSICPKHIILRVSWLYGLAGHNFVKTILRLAAERDELKIVADQFGAPTSAASVAEVVVSIVAAISQHNDLWGTYHFCNQGQTTWYEFAAAIVHYAKTYQKNLTDKIMPIASSDYLTAAKRPVNSLLSCGKVEQAFNIQRASWQSELKKFIEELLA